MAIQSAINRLVGAAGAAAVLTSKLSEDKGADKSGVDAKMAAKARKTAQEKIKTIQANKEISSKAMTRRIGVVLDEYSKAIGGNK